MRTNTLAMATTGALLALVILSCGGNAIDMLDGAIGDGMVEDAAAQSCASCNAAGAVRMVTADTDPAQLESGITVEDEPGMPDPFVVAGPFVLTDAIATAGTGRTFLYTTEGDAADDCAMAALSNGALARLESAVDTGDDRGLQGVRILIPAGQVLCASTLDGSPRVRWAGFRPY
jgi:hypothetical protein